MCKAHVLRFSCSHGLLMSLEFCSKTPCPLLKSTGKSLPQQPTRCYNCEKRRCEPTVPATISSSSPSSSSSSYTLPASSRTSCTSSIASDDANNLLSPPPTSQSLPKPSTAKGPQAGDYVMRCNRSRHGATSATAHQKPFTFACSASHLTPPHYDSLPSFLPHQTHDCASCQFDTLRVRSDADITSDAQTSWSLVRDDRQKAGRPEWEWKESRGALQRYIDERRQEEREMIFMVARKWEQDLRAMRVCWDEEAGMGLMG